MNLLLLKVLILCFSLLAGSSLLHAQQPASGERSSQESQDQKLYVPRTREGGGREQMALKENTSVVNLTVVVTDKKNRPVTGLGPEHFEVFEDKVKQKIEFFTDDDLPLSIGIIFDVSGSMKGKLDRAREALSAFIQTCHDNDDFFLVTFNQRPRLIVEFTDGVSLSRKLSSAEASGETALYDAIQLGLELVSRGRHSKRAMLVISDGEDNSSRQSFRALARLLKEANVQVYCIGIVDLYWFFGEVVNTQGHSTLADIAKVTGGKAFFPRREGELEETVTRIALELRRQYSIGYMPTNQHRDGKWRKIKVRLMQPPGVSRLIVRAREGYFAVPSQ